MKTGNFRNLLGCVTCIVLIAAMALLTCGCSLIQTPGETTPPPEALTLEDGKTYGQGGSEFALTVTHGDGRELTVTIQTDKKTVGEALQALGIVSGEAGEYGLYIKTVNGETLDYDTDGMYWSFYIGGEYALTGVDKTDIVPGTTYALKAEKG